VTGPAADPVELLALAHRLGTAAGATLREAVDRTRTLVETKSTATDLVTEMDRWSEEFLTAGILAERPDDAVRGEEGADHAGTSGIEWWIDPIDGTTNFVYGMPGFNISIAAAQGSRVLAGVVVDPLHGDVFAASLGGGATRNGEPIFCSGATALATALVATGFSYDAERRRRQAEVLTRVIGEIRDIRRVGAAAVDLCGVACGRVDAFYERGLQPWDYSAGALIATEAGAVVSDLAGGPTSPAFTLAAPPAIAEPLRALLERSGAGAA
jgi:myo-inositol-1(or 4)-monophosphatase